MTKREQMAREIYKRWSNNCLVPFEERGAATKKFCYDLADVALDVWTSPPAESAIAAGIAILVADDQTPADGWYRRLTLRVWETMVRTMVEEGR